MPFFIDIQGEDWIGEGAEGRFGEGMGWEKGEETAVGI